MVEFTYKKLSRGHTGYRLQAKEYKKKVIRYLKRQYQIVRKNLKQPRVNWSASSGVTFTRSGI